MLMKKIIKIYLLLASAVLVSSCLEDDKAPLDPSRTQNIIEFLDSSVPASPAGSIYPVYASSYLLSPQDGFELKISYSGPNENNADINLALAIDPSALDEYNTQMVHGLNGSAGLHGTTYDLMPETNYDISTMALTIPKGQSQVSLPITVYPDKFDFSRNYAIPLRIVSASTGTLSAHYSVAILAVGVRNDYDGVYAITGGNIQRNSATGPDPALSGDYVDDLEVELITLASDRVSFEPVWKDGSGIAGIDGTSITINPDNSILVKSSNPTMKHIVGTENKYDPATREFTINIEWGTAPSNRVITGLKLKYTGPRP
jgi:hypothetical protein